MSLYQRMHSGFGSTQAPSSGFQSNVRNIGSPLMQQQFGVQPPQFNAQAPQMGGQFGSYIQQLQKQIGGLGNQIQAMNQRQGQPAAQPEPQLETEPKSRMSLLDEAKDRFLSLQPKWWLQPKLQFGTREWGDQEAARHEEMWGPEGRDWDALGLEGKQEFQNWRNEQRKLKAQDNKQTSGLSYGNRVNLKQIKDQVAKRFKAKRQLGESYSKKQRQMAGSYINELNRVKRRNR